MQDYHLVLQRLKSNAQNVRSKINQKCISGIFPAIPATSRHLQYTPTKTNHYTESIQSVRILSSSKWPHHHLFITLRGLQRFPTNHQPWWDSGVSEAFSMWFWQLLGVESQDGGGKRYRGASGCPSSGRREKNPKFLKEKSHKWNFGAWKNESAAVLTSSIIKVTFVQDVLGL